MKAWKKVETVKKKHIAKQKIDLCCKNMNAQLYGSTDVGMYVIKTLQKLAKAREPILPNLI